MFWIILFGLIGLAKGTQIMLQDMKKIGFLWSSLILSLMLTIAGLMFGAAFSLMWADVHFSLDLPTCTFWSCVRN